MLEHAGTRLCVVVDALRATSSMVTMLARGVQEIAVAGSIAEARELKARMPERLLCGESGGLPPAGFDYGNSPSEFAEAELNGRTAIMATSNGTRALLATAAVPLTLTGSLLNRATAARVAGTVAEQQSWDIAFVCAGNALGTAFSLEDTAVCGAIIEQIVANRPVAIDDVVLTDTAMAAYRLWRSFTAPRAVVGEPVHGQQLTKLGLAKDLDFCAQLDRYDVAPRLCRNDDGLMVIRAG